MNYGHDDKPGRLCGYYYVKHVEKSYIGEGFAWLTGSSRFLSLCLVAHEEVGIVNAAFIISRANFFSLQMKLDSMRPFLVAGAIYFNEADLAIDGDTAFTNNSAASDGGESVHSSPVHFYEYFCCITTTTATQKRTPLPSACAVLRDLAAERPRDVLTLDNVFRTSCRKTSQRRQDIVKKSSCQRRGTGSRSSERAILDVSCILHHNPDGMYLK